jgi:hypothetical protein
MIRGQWNEASAVNAASPSVFICWCIMLLYCIVMVVMGRNWLVQEAVVLAALLAVALGAWLVVVWL